MGEVWTNGRDECHGAGGVRQPRRGCAEREGDAGEDGQTDFFFFLKGKNPQQPNSQILHPTPRFSSVSIFNKVTNALAL